jgi:gas vesicle protein
MRAKSFLLGLLIGGAAGGISTLLTAPNSGKETWKYVKANADLFQKQLTDIKNQLIALKNSAITASKEGKNSIAAFSSDIKIDITRWKQDIIPHQHVLQNEIHAIEKAIAELEKSLQVNELEKK